MYCVKCRAMVSIADKSCPNCKNDLLQFGATVFSLPDEKHRPAAEGIIGLKKAIWEEIREDMAGQVKPLDALEASIVKPLLDDLMNRLKVRYESDEQIERAFDTQVLPAVDRLKKDPDARELLREVDDLIRSRLGEDIFRHYEDKAEDVLKILRPGEIALSWLDMLAGADFSVILFPFFKAVEQSCRLHTEERHARLKHHSQLKEIAAWLPTSAEDLSIEDIPEWLSHKRRKDKIIKVVRGLLAGGDDRTSGALGTAVSLYLFGRTGSLEIRRLDLNETKAFRIDNLLETAGEVTLKEDLAWRLQRLQFYRNERIHEKVETNRDMVDCVRDMAYDCLKGLPRILPV